MNALALWLPGTALMLSGGLLWVSGQVDTTAAIAMIAAGAALETVGVLLWVWQRRKAGR